MGRGGWTHKVGVAEQLASDERNVGLTLPERRLDLLGRGEETDGADEDRGDGRLDGGCEGD